MATVPASGDVVVVGGGVIGAAVALRLADAGLDVVLAAAPADRAGQASRAAGAMLGVFSEVSAGDPPARREVDVAERLAARRLYDGWLADISDRSGIEVAVTPGLFVVGTNKAAVADVLRRFAGKETKPSLAADRTSAGSRKFRPSTSSGDADV